MRHFTVFMATLLATTGANHAGQEQGNTAAQKCANRVVFDSTREGNSQVYLLDLESGEESQLFQQSESGAGSRFPDIAAGGERVTFITENEQGTGHLFVIGIDGEDLRQLTIKAAAMSDPAWSPDGEWIAFEMKVQETWGLYLIRLDGTDLHRIGPEGVNLFQPSWAPDQSRIAVVTGNEGAWVVGLLDLANQSVEQVTGPELSVGSVKWSPGGSKLALDAVSSDFNFDLYLLDLVSGDLQRLTRNMAVDARPDWSPDEKQLVFHSTRDQGGSIAGEEQWDQFELYVLDLESGGIERLTENPWFDAHPDWCTPQNESHHPLPENTKSGRP